MEFKVKDKEFNQMVAKFQEGGEMTPPAEAPAAPQGGEDPMTQLAQAFAQGLQNQDCQLLAQAAQAFLQMIGGGAAEEAPAAPEGQQPVYGKGGRLVKWITKD